MRKLIFHPIAIFSMAILFSACSEPTTTSETDGKAEQKEIKFATKEGVYESDRKENIKKIFRALPSPVEMAELIKKSGSSFDKTVLNDPANVSKYITASQQAMNLGIYGADLSYTSIFEQDRQSLNYLDAVQEIANALDVGAAIDKEVFDRLKENQNNQDSLMSIITQTFWTINAYLKENESREETSALVIAGGWLEGLHLAGAHYEPGNKEIHERIAEQKYVLTNLIDLMETYKSEALVEVKSDLKEIQEMYKDVKIIKGKTTKNKDASGMVVIGGKKEVSMDDVTLQKVLSKIKDIRNKYIN